MVKHCDMCGIEIADTDYDTLGRYNAVKYCQECAAIRKKIANKNYRQKRKMEKQPIQVNHTTEYRERGRGNRLLPRFFGGEDMAKLYKIPGKDYKSEIQEQISEIVERLGIHDLRLVLWFMRGMESKNGGQ